MKQSPRIYYTESQKATARDPFDGIGKPEPLRGVLAGFWPRRIDVTNQLVCKATDE